MAPELLSVDQTGVWGGQSRVYGCFGYSRATCWLYALENKELLATPGHYQFMSDNKESGELGPRVGVAGARVGYTCYFSNTHSRNYQLTKELFFIELRESPCHWRASDSLSVH